MVNPSEDGPFFQDNSLRSRQVVKELSFKDPSIKEYSSVTKSNYLHRHPFMIRSESWRTFGVKKHSEVIN